MSLPRYMIYELKEKLNQRLKRANGCHEYTGMLDGGGYGVISVLGKGIRVHRLAWELYNGIIPEGLKVLHKCDNRRCFNTEHLFLGTQTDNIYDMFAKGRAGNQKGAANGNAKLTELQVQEIQQLLAEGKLKQKEIGQLYGVAQTTVSYINRAGWKSFKEKSNVAS